MMSFILLHEIVVLKEWNQKLHDGIFLLNTNVLDGNGETANFNRIFVCRGDATSELMPFVAVASFVIINSGLTD
jgi:hypothetical protein